MHSSVNPIVPSTRFATGDWEDVANLQGALNLALIDPRQESDCPTRHRQIL